MSGGEPTSASVIEEEATVAAEILQLTEAEIALKQEKEKDIARVTQALAGISTSTLDREAERAAKIAARQDSCSGDFCG